MTELFGLRHPEARRQGRALLAMALKQTRGMERMPELSLSERGKPWFPACPEIQFNWSHSGELLLCALSDRPVGVDIEVVRPRREELFLRCLTEKEQNWCDSGGDRWHRFYLLWTRRESACKRTGRGLSMPVREIAVPLPPEERLGGLSFRSYEEEGWVAALCGEGLMPEEIHWL